MTYETCKALKDVGFPQNLDGNKQMNGEPMMFRVGDPIEWLYVPTLEELIAEIEDFHELEQFKDCWEARGLNVGRECGPTPSDAVANLYLALNTH